MLGLMLIHVSKRAPDISPFPGNVLRTLWLAWDVAQLCHAPPQISSTLRSTWIIYRSGIFVSDRCFIDIDLCYLRPSCACVQDSTNQTFNVLCFVSAMHHSIVTMSKVYGLDVDEDMIKGTIFDMVCIFCDGCVIFLSCKLSLLLVW